MDQLPRDWIEKALKVTGHFEDSADPFGAVSGDFDGMGISLGVLQWNIGQNSLQPLIRALGQAKVVELMPVFGRDLWQAANNTLPNGLAIVRSWQTGATLRAPVRAELKALTHSTAFVEQQIAKATLVAQQAFAAARVFAAEDPAYGQPTLPLFAWFFDVWTQNGGLKGLGFPDVRDFIRANGITRADDVVCDWLSTRPTSLAGAKDAARNASLWRNAVPDNRLSLFVLSFLRAQRSNEQWRADVLNRKATIVVGRGFVHQEQHDLSQLLG